MTTTPSPKPSKLYVFETSKLPDSSTLDEKLGRCLICHACWIADFTCPVHGDVSRWPRAPSRNDLSETITHDHRRDDRDSAAIYTRKSNEQEKGASGASESVERQVQHARDFAVSKGWTVEPEHVYIDDMISGVEYAKLKARDRMVADAKDGKFQVLILSEQARVGRGNMIESTYILWQLSEYDVKIYEYMSGAEICVDDETGQIMTMMRSFASASERRQASRRVYDSARQRAHAGYVTGGRVFGYDNLAVTTPARRVIRTINREQAAIVERIFTLYASGIGSVTITKMLNREGCPAPRPRGWSNTGVRYVLANRAYIGDVIWNQRQTVVKRGKKRHLPRPEREWIRSTNEDLRIISDEFWHKVQTIRAARKAALPRSPKTGKLLGRASWFDGYSDHSGQASGVCRVPWEHPHSDPTPGQSLRVRDASATGPRDLPQRHHGQATALRRGA